MNIRDKILKTITVDTISIEAKEFSQYNSTDDLGVVIEKYVRRKRLKTMHDLLMTEIKEIVETSNILTQNHAERIDEMLEDLNYFESEYQSIENMFFFERVTEEDIPEEPVEDIPEEPVV
jgi:hypothetical protein